MNINKFYDWFHDYYKRFYSKDPTIMGMVSLKENHSLRVALNSKELAVNLKLTKQEVALAEIVGLLHDIARCEQAHFKTFRDSPSFDHGDIGAIRLTESDILDSLSSEERAIVIFAVKNHNKRVVSPASANEKLFTDIVRDGDKIDIFAHIKPVIADDSYSPALVKCILAGQVAPYEEIKTKADLRLIRLGWFYDINYKWTLSKLLKEKYAESLLGELPDSDEFAKVKNEFWRNVKEKSAKCL